jgi:anti-anti-sigma regulatory factor/PAS domain-containing protein
VFIVPDAQQDERFKHLPFVTGNTKIRFYAGAPLYTPDGHTLGTICVMDPEPHSLRQDQVDALRILGNEVITHLEMRQRNKQLGQLVEERNQLNEELESSLQQMYSAMEAMMDGVLLTDNTGGLVYMNQKMVQMWGVPEDLLQRGDQDEFGEWITANLTNSDEVTMWIDTLVNTHEMSDIGLLECKDGRVIEYYTQPHMLANDVVGRIWCFRDVTDRVEGEMEQERLQKAALDAQMTLVRELSTPLIPIGRNTLLMPIIGSIDEARAEQIVQTLAAGLNRYKASTVILDVVGARSVASEASRAFVQAARTIRLLGAQMMITGITPEMAQTFVSLQLELPGIQISNSLQEGLQRLVGRL